MFETDKTFQLRSTQRNLADPIARQSPRRLPATNLGLANERAIETKAPKFTTWVLFLGRGWPTRPKLDRSALGLAKGEPRRRANLCRKNACYRLAR